MPDEAAKRVIATLEGMKTGRSTWDSHWQEISDVIFPLALHFTRFEHPGAKAHDKIFDSSGEQAGEMLAGALLGFLVSPDRPWFSLKAADDDLNADDEVASWLADATRRMLKMFNRPKSGFYPTQHEKYMDLVNFGTGGQFIAERPGLGPRFLGRPLAQLYLRENADGEVDTVYRHYKLKAHQALQAFGAAAGPQAVKKAEKPKTAEDTFEFIHAVEPRRKRNTARLDPRNMAFASWTVNLTERHTVRESGFREMPLATPRWFRRYGENYGRGPGSKALADVKMLQRSMKVTIRGTEKIVDPPLQVADDGVLAPIRMTPSGLNFVRPDLLQSQGGGIRPVITGARPDLGEAFMEGVRVRIDGAYFKPLLQLSRDPRMTASQFLGLQQEALQILSPFLGRLQTEDLGPVIDRTFAIMLRQGMFLPVPARLAEAELEVEYLSPVARAQRLEEARGVSSTLELMAPLIERQPEILDNVDSDATFRFVADTLNWPRDTFRALEVVRQMRQARTEERAQQEQIAAAGDIAQAVGRAAPALELLQGGAEREAA